MAQHTGCVLSIEMAVFPWAAVLQTNDAHQDCAVMYLVTFALTETYSR